MITYMNRSYLSTSKYRNRVGWYFFCGSFLFFCLAFAMPVRVCLYVPCGHLLGKG